ncbi:hypothetical protein CPC08DRAFT_701741 [Agrocybe pediades]|nr:hypothetical protein CPC08DRAFT_701741 [Agrocybe pediades]
MLKHASNPNTLTLLDAVVVRLVYRARNFSRPAANSTGPRDLTPGDVPNIHSRIREQIMAQAHTKPRTSVKAHNQWLSQVQRAVEAKDLSRALSSWVNLCQAMSNDDADKPYRMHLSTEQKLGQLLMLRLQHNNSPFSNANIEENAQKFALQTAVHGMADPLAAVMCRHLQNADSQKVLDLYQRFLQELERHEPTAKEEPVLLDEEASDSDFDPGRVSVLIAVVVAHAMNDSFKGAFDAYMAANIRIRNYRKQKILNHLKVSSAIRDRAHIYVDRLELAVLVARPHSLSKHVMNLSYPRSAPLLERLYNDILEGIDGFDPYLAANEADLSDTRLVAMTDACWTAFQTAFIKSERTDLAVKMWDDLARRGIRPGVSMWTALLDTYADLRDSKQAMKTWNLMLQQDIVPDGLSYRAIIAALFDDNKAEQAMQRFREYQQIFKSQDSAALAVYNTILRGLLRTNQIKEAAMLLGTMLGRGPAPDIVSYNTFLGYYRRQSDFQGISSIVTRMADAGITGDVVTFSTILVALLEVGRKDAPDIILGIMAKQGVRPNVATYTAIIADLMKQQTEKSLDAAIQLLDKMEQSPETKPNEVTYTSILSGINKASWLTRPRREEIKSDIVSRMRRFNIAFRVPTYHILMQSALDSPNPDGYLEALALLQEMESQSVPRVNNTWYILLLGLIRRELWDVGLEVVTRMYRSGHQPTASLAST